MFPQDPPRKLPRTSVILGDRIRQLEEEEERRKAEERGVVLPPPMEAEAAAAAPPRIPRTSVILGDRLERLQKENEEVRKAQAPPPQAPQMPAQVPQAPQVPSPIDPQASALLGLSDKPGFWPTNNDPEALQNPGFDQLLQAEVSQGNAVTQGPDGNWYSRAPGEPPPGRQVPHLRAIDPRLTHPAVQQVAQALGEPRPQIDLERFRPPAPEPPLKPPVGASGGVPVGTDMIQAPNPLDSLTAPPVIGVEPKFTDKQLAEFAREHQAQQYVGEMSPGRRYLGSVKGATAMRPIGTAGNIYAKALEELDPEGYSAAKRFMEQDRGWTGGLGSATSMVGQVALEYSGVKYGAAFLAPQVAKLSPKLGLLLETIAEDPGVFLRQKEWKPLMQTLIAEELPYVLGDKIGGADNKTALENALIGLAGSLGFEGLGAYMLRNSDEALKGPSRTAREVAADRRITEVLGPEPEGLVPRIEPTVPETAAVPEPAPVAPRPEEPAVSAPVRGEPEAEPRRQSDRDRTAGRLREERRKRFAAEHNAVTRLPNRARFDAAAERATADPNMSVGAVDVSNFKVINERQGYAAGDDKLRQVGNALRQASREVTGSERAVFHFGGDEFGVVGRSEAVPKILQRAHEILGTEVVGEYPVQMRWGVGSGFPDALAQMDEVKKAETFPKLRSSADVPTAVAGDAPRAVSQPAPMKFEEEPLPWERSAAPEQAGPQPLFPDEATGRVLRPETPQGAQVPRGGPDVGPGVSRNIPESAPAPATRQFEWREPTDPKEIENIKEARRAAEKHRYRASWHRGTSYGRANPESAESIVDKATDETNGWLRKKGYALDRDGNIYRKGDPEPIPLEPGDVAGNARLGASTPKLRVKAKPEPQTKWDDPMGEPIELFPGQAGKRSDEVLEEAYRAEDAAKAGVPDLAPKVGEPYRVGGGVVYRSEQSGKALFVDSQGAVWEAEGTGWKRATDKAGNPLTPEQERTVRARLDERQGKPMYPNEAQESAFGKMEQPGGQLDEALDAVEESVPGGTIEVVNLRGANGTPPDVDYVGRPTPLGNPFPKGPNRTRAEAISAYREWLIKQLENPKSPAYKHAERLRQKYATEGKLKLGCWCHPKPCHCDVIREFIMDDSRWGREGRVVRSLLTEQEIKAKPLKELEPDEAKRLIVTDPEAPDRWLGKEGGFLDLRAIGQKVMASTAGRLAKRLFAAPGEVTHEVFEAWVLRGAGIRGQLRRAENSLNDVRQLILDEFPSVGTDVTTDPHLLTALNNELMGQQVGTPVRLSDELRTSLRALRGQMDALTVRMRAEGLVSGALDVTMGQGLGTYLTRTYRQFEFPRQFVHSEEGIKAVFAWAKNDLGATDKEAWGIVKELMTAGSFDDAWQSVRGIRAGLKQGGQDVFKVRAGFVPQEVRAGVYEVLKEFGIRFEKDIDEMIDAYIGRAPNDFRIQSKLQEALDAVRAKVPTSDKHKSFLDFRASQIRDLQNQLERRQEVPDALRLLFGEEKDPLIRVAQSIAKASENLHSARFARTVLDVGERDGWVQKASEGGAATPEFAKEWTKLTPDVQKTFSGKVFNETGENYYIRNDVLEAMQNRFLVRDPGNLGWTARAGRQATFLIKGNMTYRNPTTHARNFIGASYFLGLNGHIGIHNLGRHLKGLVNAEEGGLKRAFLVAREGLRGQWDFSTDFYRKIMDEYTDLGIVDTSIRSREFADNMREALDYEGNFYDLFRNKESAIIRAGVRVDELLNDLYRMEDDIAKIMMFENEKIALEHYWAKEASRPGGPRMTVPTSKQIKEEAALLSQNLYPNYDRLPVAIQKLRASPIFSAFPSFGWEVLRTGVHHWERTMYELAHPVLRVRGIARLMGGVQAAMVPTTIQAVARAAAGVSYEEQRALERTRGGYQENNTLVITGRNDDGTYNFIDMSYTDPGSIYRAAFRAMVGHLYTHPGEGPTAVSKGIGELTEAFRSEEILFGTVLDLLRNSDEFGRPISKDQGGKGGLAHTYKKLEPGIFRTGNRIWDAVTQEMQSNFTTRSLGSEVIGAVGGLRPDVANPKADIYWKLGRMKGRLDESRAELDKMVQSLQPVSDAELVQAYMRADGMRRQAMFEAGLTVQDGRYLGVDEEVLDGLVNSLGVPLKDRKLMMSQTYTPLEFGATYKQNAMETLRLRSPDQYVGEDLASEVQRRVDLLNRVSSIFAELEGYR